LQQDAGVLIVQVIDYRNQAWVLKKSRRLAGCRRTCIQLPDLYPAGGTLRL